MGLFALLSYWGLGACVLLGLAKVSRDVSVAIVMEPLWAFIVWKVHAEAFTVTIASVWSAVLFGYAGVYAYSASGAISTCASAATSCAKPEERQSPKLFGHRSSSPSSPSSETSETSFPEVVTAHSG